MNDEIKVLSIQSHVVSGYVGNKSAVFPLQVLGFDVDNINTVQLSNHVAYSHWGGEILDASHLKSLYKNLALNNIHNYSYLLTGYVGSISFATELINVIKDLKKVNPDIYIVCDPVMGDNGKMYVPKDFLKIYRDQIIPLSNLITPNQFEIELLTEMTIESEDDVFKAMQILHEKGIETIVLSSAKIGPEKTLALFASCVKEGKKTAIRIDIPEFSMAFTGTGDLFAATLLAWMSKTNYNLKVSCERALSTMHSVLQRTYDYAKAHTGTDGKINKKSVELKLIQSKTDIESPEELFFATVLT